MVNTKTQHKDLKWERELAHQQVPFLDGFYEDMLNCIQFINNLGKLLIFDVKFVTYLNSGIAL